MGSLNLIVDTKEPNDNSSSLQKGVAHINVTIMASWGISIGDLIFLHYHAETSDDIITTVAIAWPSKSVHQKYIQLDPLLRESIMVPIGELVTITPTPDHTLTSKHPTIPSSSPQRTTSAFSSPTPSPSPTKQSNPSPSPFSHMGQPLVVDATKIEVEACTPSLSRSLSKEGMEASIVPFLRSSLAGSYSMMGQLFGVSIYGKSHKFRMFKIDPQLSMVYTVWRVTVNTSFVVKQTSIPTTTQASSTSTSTFPSSPPSPSPASGISGSLDRLTLNETNEKSSLTQKLSFNSSVGGLNKQVRVLKEMVEFALKDVMIFSKFGQQPPRGVLLYGPPGTGKTLLARVVAEECEAKVFTIHGPSVLSPMYGTAEQKIREIFKEAERNSPALIFIDEIDSLCGKRDDEGGAGHNSRMVATLLTQMDGIRFKNSSCGKAISQVVVLATTNKPNSLDPALRRPGRFDRELEVPPPTASDRKHILKIILGRMPHSLSDEDIEHFANVTHGYVGADLESLVKEAALVALHRKIELQKQSSESHNIPPYVCKEDLGSVLGIVRPSAMRSLDLQVASVHFDEIGGQGSVKQRLREAVEWPLKYPERMACLGVRPPKGILLYGPPGCSKTLLAKALATESGLNFIAIKGPELYSMWVGQSERQVQDVFSKARSASPSVLFFDELDGLASIRGGGGGGATDRVLSQLLTEMDGLAPLKDVTLLAATNRPDRIDPALLRPGRFDRILYVAPPGKEERVEIIEIYIKKIPHSDDVNVDVIADKVPPFFVLHDGYLSCRMQCGIYIRQRVVQDSHQLLQHLVLFFFYSLLPLPLLLSLFLKYTLTHLVE
eukprot:Phypoly_transcript_02294.p1 GENE.Phypoly_transcript_02294~~Phypoly_transcript_02294.p1  ORF type:complete len:833 (+),score=116.63 Phypoly_transcript_02294:34-2532(+)